MHDIALQDRDKKLPRRLLHIPTMTSVERESEDVYLGKQKPVYSILTYTWGRWSSPDGARLNIAGTTWKIPAVICFTPDDLRRVLITMSDSGAVEFAWIDIACIDQEDEAVKMDEIGRQAGIFANASQAYVWLWTLEHDLLDTSILDIRSFSAHQAPPLFSSDGKERTDFASAFVKLERAVHSIFEDYWFYSLWMV